ncbi:C2 calcium-dependent domain-containing protein 4C [Lepisosteus oculatus]|uniref:C2 calcium-dependent domain-containing protein 4C-like n=1 Tax=Lepisosteus oculatus TaxID=7918 RepID=W5NLY6_LEPOC|nr:PREDICTED: C2 calcium-dependent domain-containing protein 4C-like [Lepisosteus oculatus]
MWLIDKLRERVENIPLEDNRAFSGVKMDSPSEANLSSKLHSNVLTPDTIPDFFIPPKFFKHTGNVEHLSAKCKVSLSTSKNNLKNLTNTHIFHVKPESYCKNNEGKDLVKLANQLFIQIEKADDCTLDNMENTNKSKQRDLISSFPSVLLPHTAACFSLTGLYESPNTRRKESLFHTDFASYALQRKQHIANKKFAAPRSSSHTSSTNITHSLKKQGTTENNTPSSNESSPHSTPVLPRSFSGTCLFKLFGQESFLKDISRSSSKQSLGGNSSFSTDECSSGDTSPCTSEKSESEGKSEAPGCSLSPPVLFPLDLLHCQEKLRREHIIPLQGRGCIRLSLEYDSSSATVRVRVVSVENLYDCSFEAKHINCCVIVCLVPGKQQKQHSTIIKNSKNPIFNEDFFFDGVTEEDLQSMSLKFKVINKAFSLKRDTLLGVISKPLSQLLPL